MGKEIKSRILANKLVDLDYLHAFQGESKDLSLENYEKLRRLLITDGFSFSCHAWESDGKAWIIDGHQRLAVLRTLRDEGYSIPKISCTFIEAKDRREAKKLVMMAISQYGKLNRFGFEKFIGTDSYDFADFDFPDFTWTEEQDKEPKPTTDSKELDSEEFNTFDNQCPKCGFEFDSKK